MEARNPPPDKANAILGVIVSTLCGKTSMAGRLFGSRKRSQSLSGQYSISGTWPIEHQRLFPSRQGRRFRQGGARERSTKRESSASRKSLAPAVRLTSEE